MTSIQSRLDDLQRIGIKLGLENIRTLLNFLQNPERKFFSILIAGTNGKGSVGAMMEKIFEHHGYKTGFFSSPHLVTVRERIRAGGMLISAEDFEKVLTEVFSAIDQLLHAKQLPGPPTYFETLMAAAMVHFRNAAVKFAVVEVGLGGRYDATNVIDQNLSVITSIDYDHQEYLGGSLGKIAAEKAAICKSRVPLITGVLPDEALPPIQQAVLQNECKWIKSDPDDIENLTLSDGFPQFAYRPWHRNVLVNLRGKHQARNAAVVLAACTELIHSGIALRQDTVVDALAHVQWPGRLELLSQDPPVLLDCAHNPMGVQTLADFLRDMQWGPAIALFTAMKDKNISEMLGRISNSVEEMILTRVEPLERCASGEQLIHAAAFLGKKYQFLEPVEDAFPEARNRSKQRNVPLIIFGSIYLAGKILTF